ncbi:hypothetical protein CLG96_16170 [Sphingomonas oleivorans]|uniref:Hemerythrin-like domain-containing protein n=1 Tax=Sphingomonas oleivorans TaxID=1735121 RepID=A0A2T5FUM4_9SPHN|nr:hypothetical protein [Sphingomonas oleivorans]PTQ08232.1 hypothetical protein CLG96_16170 [Sphingomonas oleivorans]
MIQEERSSASVIPFARRWSVIHPIDIARLMADHARLRMLCNALEACADALPERPSPAEAEALCHQLAELLSAQERGEKLLALMFGHDEAEPLTHALLRHIRHRHIAGTVHAQDLIAALMPSAEKGPAVSTDALGYMLRCFFEACRQTMDFEELLILALGANRLTQPARHLLTDSLDRNLAGC